MSSATKVFDDVCEFAEHLRRLRAKRAASKLSVRTAGLTRLALSPKQREAVLKKTAGRCHVCGGSIEDTWCADHVFAHSHGGLHTEDNYLPAHDLCNNYRWFYGSEEFQWILKLGVWLRTRIERKDVLALRIADHFLSHEKTRRARQRRASFKP
jgi:hypothetical protein